MFGEQWAKPRARANIEPVNRKVTRCIQYTVEFEDIVYMIIGRSGCKEEGSKSLRCGER